MSEPLLDHAFSFECPYRCRDFLYKIASILQGETERYGLILDAETYYKLSNGQEYVNGALGLYTPWGKMKIYREKL